MKRFLPFFFGVFALLSILLPTSAHAQLIQNPLQGATNVINRCGAPEEGRRFSIWRRAGEDFKCVHIRESQQSVVFQDLVRAGVLKQAWAGAQVTEQAFNRCQNAYFSTGESSDADETSYILGDYKNFRCQGQGDEQVYNAAIRYKIDTPDGTEYFSFILNGPTLDEFCFDNPGEYECEIRFDYRPTSKSICDAITVDDPPQLCRDILKNNDPQQATTQNEFLSCMRSEKQACLARCVDCNSATGGSVGTTRTKPDGYEGPLPDCAFTYEGCREANDLLELLINVGKMIFGLIGTLAFIMFIYGGVTMITAMGNADRFKQGTNILGAAVIGLIISFGAFILVEVLLDALQVQEAFRGL